MESYLTQIPEWQFLLNAVVPALGDLSARLKLKPTFARLSSKRSLQTSTTTAQTPMPRGIPNAKRDETGMRFTTFNVPLP